MELKRILDLIRDMGPVDGLEAARKEGATEEDFSPIVRTIDGYYNADRFLDSAPRRGCLIRFNRDSGPERRGEDYLQPGWVEWWADPEMARWTLVEVNRGYSDGSAGRPPQCRYVAGSMYTWSGRNFILAL